MNQLNQVTRKRTKSAETGAVLQLVISKDKEWFFLPGTFLHP
jgi:hypothetical protein